MKQIVQGSYPKTVFSVGYNRINMIARQATVLLIVKHLSSGLTMQYHHTAGMGAYIYLIRCFIYIYRFNVFKRNTFRYVRIKQIVLISFRRIIIEVQTTVTCADP